MTGRWWTVIAAALLILALPSPGRAAQNPDRAVTEALGRIYRLPTYSAFDWIAARYLRGTLTLEGFVRTKQLKDDAGRAARGAPGIDDIVNNIEVLPAHGSDEQIRRQAYLAVYGGMALERYAPGGRLSAADVSDLQQAAYFGLDGVSVARGPHAIHILVNGARILLRGQVRNAGDRQLAEGAVRSLPGVLNVVNELRVSGQR